MLSETPGVGRTFVEYAFTMMVPSPDRSRNTLPGVGSHKETILEPHERRDLHLSKSQVNTQPFLWLYSGTGIGPAPC